MASLTALLALSTSDSAFKTSVIRTSPSRYFFLATDRISSLSFKIFFLIPIFSFNAFSLKRVDSPS